MKKALRLPDYLAHIVDAIDRVTRYTAGMDQTAFLASPLVQDAVIRNIEIVGEASSNIQRVDPVFAAEHADIPWQVMYAMRNRVSHGYAEVDLEIVWKTIQGDLPELRSRIATVLASLVP
jgi:uncharacterized protein with HEPN domain